MSGKDSPHLLSLERILNETNKGQLFACIKDLVSNGLTFSRFSHGENSPSRQDITQFIAAWFRRIGVPPETCREWMIEYCVDILSPISSSSKSQIRHSTKSNIKYIYRSEVQFDCGAENNPFRAPCKKGCPLYKEMQIRYKERQERDANRSYEPKHLPKDYGVEIAKPPVKEIHGEQFKKGLKLIEDNLGEGASIKEIVSLLKDRGLKSRTGKEWTDSILRAEINRPGFKQKDMGKGAKYSPVKGIYREQFEKAIEFSEKSLRKGGRYQDIVNLLNEKGFKTRTGRTWNYGVLKVEMKKYNLIT
jgi:hypothetical protein